MVIKLWGSLVAYLNGVQLSVPVIAALGGVLFMSEPITIGLTLSALMILGRILLVVLGDYFFSENIKYRGGNKQWAILMNL